MKTRNLRLSLIVIGVIAILPAAAAILLPAMLAGSPTINWSRVAAVARQHTNFTVEQRQAVIREIRAEEHPLWKTLSPAARLRRAAAYVMRMLPRQSEQTTSPTAAPVLGNQTFISNPTGDMIGLQRQSNCSLSLYDGSFTFATSQAFPTLQFTTTTASYEQVLHAESGLTTQAGVFAKGCVDPSMGIGSRRGAYLGKTAQGQYLIAWDAYNSIHNANALYSATVNPATMAVQSSNADFSMAGIQLLTAGDLNGDGLADVVGLDPDTASISVWLANADGTLGAPTSYTLPANVEAAVIADVNGDGKPDLVVATRNATYQEQISVLTGNGNGTLNAAQSFNVATPTGSENEDAFIGSLIAADIRGDGRTDIIGSNGLLLLNNGDGTFTAGTPVFPPTVATSEFGNNMAAADFNNDGKLDVAVDNGTAVYIYLGNGDGTFTTGRSYASDTDVGYLTATDIDGDGNVDLWIGTANSGVFGGDQFGVGQAYALMGNGNGTFQGAPVVPFIYTGTNLADLNGDGNTDAVAVNPNLSFTTYLGDGKGGFTAKSTLIASPVTLYGTPYTLPTIDSYGLADVTGDGKLDLVFIADLVVRPPTGFDTPGVLIAAGDGQGDFATPTFFPTQNFAPNGDVDANPQISNLHLADVNNDGKPDLIYSLHDEDYTTATFYAGIVVQRGNGDGTFQPPQPLWLFSGPSSANQIVQVLNVVDLNGDGKPDLVLLIGNLVNQMYQWSLEVALGNGDGTFGTPTTVTTTDVIPDGVIYGTQYLPLVVADMNGDGIPDLVALGESTSGNMQVAIALGNGDGTFKAPNKTTLSIPFNDEGLAVADLNGDGKLDVAVGGYFGSSDSGIIFGNGDGTLAPLTAADGSVGFNELYYMPMGGATVAVNFTGGKIRDVLSGSTLLVTEATTTATPDFTLTASGTSGTVTAGQSVQTTLTLTPANGFDQTVSLSCSGLPAGAACDFAPASLPVDGNATTSKLTISTTARTAMKASGRPFDPWLPGGALLASIGMPIVWRRRRVLAGHGHVALVVLLLFTAIGLAGCGGSSSGGGASPSGSSSSSGGSTSSSSSGSGSTSSSSSGGGSSSSSSSGSSSSGGGSTGTPAGTYSVTVTATGGPTTHTLTFSLTVS
jgi:hypothetical protein